MIELLILFILLDKSKTMYGISKEIKDGFNAFTRPSFGAINPALKRLEKSSAIKTRKIMTDGGKLSVYYEITQNGLEELKRLLLAKTSSNPLQFHSSARVKISCASFLAKDERADLFFKLKSIALEHKLSAEKTLESEHAKISFYQRIMLDNAICEYNNLVKTIEALEKENVS